MKLQYKCKKIITDKDLDDENNIIAVGFFQVCDNFSNTLQETWKSRYNFLRPGKAESGAVALSICVSADITLSANDANTFATLVCTACGREFSDVKNVLSCAYRSANGHIDCYTVVIPMDRRIPNADKWINERSKDQPNDALKIAIDTKLKTSFNDIEITGQDKKEDLNAEGFLAGYFDHKSVAYEKKFDTILKYTVHDPDKAIQTLIPYDKVIKAADDTLGYFTTGPEHLYYERSLNPSNGIDEDDFMKRIHSHLTTEYKEIKGNDLKLAEQRIHRGIYGNYILDPLINEDEISDIMVVAPDNIRVKAHGERYTTNIKFSSTSDYNRFIQGLAIKNNLSLRDNAINVFSDIYSNPYFRMRFNITTPYINSCESPYLHIRKIAKQKRDFDYLIKNGMLDERLMNYLIDRARTSPGMIFTGKGASGKTTLMNILLDFIPFDRSALVIQESEELFTNVHPHIMFEHVVNNVGKGQKKYELQDLARNGLLTDLDYFVIGEIKGAEAKYFLNAADTGHQCWCSVHSPSSVEAIDKISDYVMYETKYSKEDCQYMLKNLGTVIFLKNFKVCEISEISGWDDQNKCLKYTPVYKRPAT
jgi:pilus assembly protein CpaF